MDLKGKVAVVTGGNGGLGQRICHALAAEGCQIAVVYAKSKVEADGVARDLEKHQVAAAAFACAQAAGPRRLPPWRSPRGGAPTPRWGGPPPPPPPTTMPLLLPFTHFNPSP